VVTGSVPDYHGVRGRHGHRAHADGVHVRRTRVYADRMILRHGGHHYVLHNLAKLARQVGIELAHLNRHAAGFAHVADDHLLVAALMIQLRRRLLHQHLTLADSRRSFLSRILRLLTLPLRLRGGSRTRLLHRGGLARSSTQHHGRSGCRRRALYIVI